MKRILAVLISVVMLITSFTACINGGDVVSDSTPTPEPTPFSPVDVTETMSDELKAEFSEFVYSEMYVADVAPYNIVESFDCMQQQDMRHLVWSLFADGGMFYLGRSLPQFEEYYKNNTWENTQEGLKVVSAELVEFCMKEYYNLSQEVPEFENIGEGYSPDSVYYSDGYYYMTSYGRSGTECRPSIDKIYDLGDNRYYFQYKLAHMNYEIYEYEVTDSQLYYAVMERKTINNEELTDFEFWSVVKTSTEPIEF